MNVKITDMRVLVGDSAFLLDNGKTAILYDTGFSFTGCRIAEKVKQALGERPLDYIFLTHSHYDHALAATQLLKFYPNAAVVAGEYAAEIFAKPGARRIMRELDSSAARANGVTDYEYPLEEIKVDIVVRDGDKIRCGEMEFTVISLPGHTKCSVGFYLESEKLLLGCETLGNYFEGGIYVPYFLVGYQMTLNSFEKVEQLDLRALLVPHYGVMEGEAAKTFLRESKAFTTKIATKIKEILCSGGGTEEFIEYCKKTFYKGPVLPCYPIDAFTLNTGIMLELVRKELM